eukprot:1458853-Rhodomonas_salina.1
MTCSSCLGVQPVPQAESTRVLLLVSKRMPLGTSRSHSHVDAVPTVTCALTDIIVLRNQARTRNPLIGRCRKFIENSHAVGIPVSAAGSFIIKLPVTEIQFIQRTSGCYGGT